MNQLANQPLSATTLFVARLCLENFRNYDLIEFLFAPPTSGAMMTVILGNNGAGKTNMLEALSLLTPGRGLRPNKAASRSDPTSVGGDERIRFGSNRWRLRADIAFNQEPEILKIEFCPDSQKIKSFLNHNPIKSSERNLSCVWVLPRHDRLFQEPASERRRFLDRLITAIHGGHQSAVISLGELLKQRRVLLEQRLGDETWLKVLEKRIAEKAVAVGAARLDYAKKLNQALVKGFAFLPPMKITLSGMVEEALETNPAAEVEEIYRHHLTSERNSDNIEGPHRSDFIADHLGKNLTAPFCSTGEQKLLVLAIMVAAIEILTAEFGRPPLFLLDDIVSHLDDDHRNDMLRLFRSLADNLAVPCFLTGTRAGDFATLRDRAQFITLAEGRIIG
ncbi:MAG: AAA family ATPase [Alphaproteobacteria bacterium]|nr:AAA family ATPase [Alphaproteobacteria bacterium]